MTPTPLYWPQTNIQRSLHLSLIHLHSISISFSRFCFFILLHLHLTIPLALAPQLITGELRISSLCNQEPVQLLSLRAKVGTWSSFCKLNIVHYKSRMCSLFCTHPAAPLDLLFTRLLHHLFHAALHENHYRGFTPIQQRLFPDSSTLTGRLQVLFSLQDFLLQPQITFPVDKSNSVAAYPTLPAHPETPIFPLKGQHLTPPSCTAALPTWPQKRDSYLTQKEVGACYVTAVRTGVAISHFAQHSFAYSNKNEHLSWDMDQKYKSSILRSLFNHRLQSTTHRPCLFKVLLFAPPKKTPFLPRNWKADFYWDPSKKDCLLTECVDSVII